MKRLLGLVLCFVLLLGMFATGVSAQERNLCENFEVIEWFEACYNNGLENEYGFSEKIIHRYVSNSLIQSNEYSNEGGFIYVPSSDYENEVNFWFNTSSTTINNIRSLYYSDGELVTESTDSPVFNGSKYVIPITNVMSDKQVYFLEGYIERGDKYEVYLNLRKLENQKPEGTEGKDYFEEQLPEKTLYYTPTQEWMKYTVTYINSQIKYYSAVKVAGLPDGIIKPGDAVTSTPEDTSSTESDTSETSSGLASISSSTSSGVTSSKEENSVPSVIQVNTVAKISGVELKAAEGVFPENTAFSITLIEDGIAYDTAKSALDGKANRFTAYNIAAANAGMAVQPNGTVTAVFSIPEGYEITKLAVIHISDDGKTEELHSIVDKKTHTITAEIPHFSIFVVAEMMNETNVTVKEDNTGLIVLVIVLIVLLLAGVGFLVWFFIFYRKKAKKPVAKRSEPEENDDDMIIFP